MSSGMNRQVLLANRPKGEPQESDFTLVEAPIPEPGPGQFLGRTIYLSLDPYMRGRMSAAASYAQPAEVGQVMVGGTVSQVVRSQHPGFADGDFALGYSGWQEYAVSDGRGVHKIDPGQGPISYFLGVLGMPGLTAYAALLDIGRPRAGETVVVSSAAGAVGSVVGQIAKIQGCRAVGVAGSDAKCAHAVSVFGFDACINRRTEDLHAALARTCPSGIDIYYDNVAGPVLEAVLRHLNVGARIPLVGLIAQYNATTLPPGPNLLPLLIKRALIQGFLVIDHEHRREAFLRDVSGWLKDGRLKYKEDVVQGLENAPRAFLGLFRGENFGKLLVQVSPDPTKPGAPRR
jgi:NADPH-dependent curcumin reductase CurA